MKLSDKTVLIFGGTGSLGQTLVKRLKHIVAEVYVFSRDEAKHHYIKLEHPEVHNILGDIRDYDAVVSAIQACSPHIIINAAALKQVPICEFYPFEAVRTNTIGSRNLVKAVENCCPDGGVKVLSISTDKACKPVNVYGMTKALQERIHLNGKNGVYNCVRYGNVLESTGSVIPVYKKMLEEGKNPLCVTHAEMTRFFLSLDQSVDLILTALKDNGGGKIFIPKVKSAKIFNLAHIMAAAAGKPDYPIKITGIRPGEKLDEILVSEEEMFRTEDVGDCYIINDIKAPMELSDITSEYSSATDLMTYDELSAFLVQHGVV